MLERIPQPPKKTRLLRLSVNTSIAVTLITTGWLLVTAGSYLFRGKEKSKAPENTLEELKS